MAAGGVRWSVYADLDRLLASDEQRVTFVLELALR